MSDALALPSPPLPLAITARLEELVDKANELSAKKHASTTRRAYLSDFASFQAWCSAHGLASIPATPAIVALYVTDLYADGAGQALSTIERALAGIAHAHRSRGFEWPRSEPTIAKVMAGIRVGLKRAPKFHKAPVDDHELGALVATLGAELVDRRDRAILTMGWLGAFRRSELVAVKLEDITRVREGLRVLLHQSKTDQQGEGDYIALPYASDASLCPVRALDEWIAAAAITSGPIFRSVHRSGRVLEDALSAQSVALIVKRAAVRAGLDPKTLAGHSLRAGFATTAAVKGKSTRAIAKQMRHKSETTTLRYIRPACAFKDNAAVGLV